MKNNNEKEKSGRLTISSGYSSGLTFSFQQSVFDMEIYLFIICVHTFYAAIFRKILQLLGWHYSD